MPVTGRAGPELFALTDLRPLFVTQHPNVAFDFDHWEECEEDSPFSKGEMGSPAPGLGGWGSESGLTYQLFLGILPL